MIIDAGCYRVYLTDTYIKGLRYPDLEHEYSNIVQLKAYMYTLNTNTLNGQCVINSVMTSPSVSHSKCTRIAGLSTEHLPTKRQIFLHTTKMFLFDILKKLTQAVR